MAGAGLVSNAAGTWLQTVRPPGTLEPRNPLPCHELRARGRGGDAPCSRAPPQWLSRGHHGVCTLVAHSGFPAASLFGPTFPRKSFQTGLGQLSIGELVLRPRKRSKTQF